MGSFFPDKWALHLLMHECGCAHTHIHCKSAKGLTVTEHVHAFTHNYPNYTGTSLSLQLGIYCLRRGALPLVVQREDRCAVCFGHTYNIPGKSQSRHTAICPRHSLNLPIENLMSCFTRELLTFSLACCRSSVFFFFPVEPFWFYKSQQQTALMLVFTRCCLAVQQRMGAGSCSSLRRVKRGPSRGQRMKAEFHQHFLCWNVQL